MGFFLVGHIKVKDGLELCPVVLLFHHQMQKQYEIYSAHLFFHWGPKFLRQSLERRVDPHIGDFDCMLASYEWRDQ